MANESQLEMDLQKPLIETFGVSRNGYVNSFLCNVYNGRMPYEHRQMFKKGSGSELDSKARAVHSSSMLAYNFFSWINSKNTFTWNKVTYSEVYFEVKLPTIKKSNAPANMDIVLKGEEGEGSNKKTAYLFIESKFLEYTRSEEFDLSESYCDSNRYYYNSDVWPSVINEWKKQQGLKSKYQGGIKQSFCHLIGLGNLNNDQALKKFNEKNKEFIQIKNINNVNIRFANVVFEPKNEYTNEHNEYKYYHEDYNCFLMHLDNKIKPIPDWYSYSDVWSVMKDQIKDECRLSYIERRYMRFAQ